MTRKLWHGMLAIPLFSVLALAANWAVSDGGNTTIVSNSTAAQDYVIRNNGVDSALTIKVKNSSGVVVETVELGMGTDVTVGVPKGGSIEIHDGSDNDTDGATGTYNKA